MFNQDKHRKPIKGEHVKIAGRDGWGQVKKVTKGVAIVDFDYNKCADWKKPENVIKVPLAEISEVMADYAAQMLVAEVEVYDQYLTGEVFGYKAEKWHCTCPEEDKLEDCSDPEECDKDCQHCEIEEVDSCWGFFGTDHKESGLIDQLGSEFAEVIDQANEI